MAAASFNASGVVGFWSITSRLTSARSPWITPCGTMRRRQASLFFDIQRGWLVWGLTTLPKSCHQFLISSEARDGV